ncbi:hypothetical protein JG688_00000147 [Phytophthora aleatoria]|uniref:Uncharacterized protein n=1 Tax=Phytophthora aleatoria TaxID=2496075 RepID=A0A8J5MCI3_9STRA|nr:hypothetical protein JG688_00000147 [Phytophthora aleatoria]
MAFYIRLIWEFQGVVEKRIEAVPNDKGQRVKEFRWEVPGVMISAKLFQENRWTVMRNALDISRFETRSPHWPLSKAEFMVVIQVEENCEHASHLFANQTTTDGYGASILLFRPKMEDEKRSTKKFSESPVAPAGYVPDVVIGLDPGMRALYSKQAKYLERLKYFWRHIDFLLQFCADRPFLKWKFFRKRMARVTVDEIAKRIVPAVCKKTCVAYGD